MDLIISLLRQQYNHTVSNVAKVFECMNIVFLSTHLFLPCAFFLSFFLNCFIGNQSFILGNKAVLVICVYYIHVFTELHRCIFLK